MITFRVAFPLFIIFSESSLAEGLLIFLFSSRFFFVLIYFLWFLLKEDCGPDFKLTCDGRTCGCHGNVAKEKDDAYC
jgi:hypothetical protein